MEGKERSHFNNIIILAALVLVIIFLGWATIKNQPTSQPPSIIDQPQASPTPFVFRIEEPPASPTPTAGVTLKEVKPRPAQPTSSISPL